MVQINPSFQWQNIKIENHNKLSTLQQIYTFSQPTRNQIIMKRFYMVHNVSNCTRDATTGIWSWRLVEGSSYSNCDQINIGHLIYLHRECLFSVRLSVMRWAHDVPQYMGQYSEELVEEPKLIFRVTLCQQKKAQEWILKKKCARRLKVESVFALEVKIC